MKTLIFVVLIVIALVLIGRQLRRREIEKFRESDAGFLNEIRQDVAPSDEAIAAKVAARTDLLSDALQANPEIPTESIGSEVKSIIFTERQRRYLELLEGLITDRYRVFVNLPLSDVLKTQQQSRVAFVISDGQYLSVEVFVEFKDQLNETTEALLLASGKPLLTFTGNEGDERIKALLTELSLGLVKTVEQPRCPKCFNDMRLRAPESGKHAGKRFWLCKTYPQCRGAQPA
jgi:hypothetical protein